MGGDRPDTKCSEIGKFIVQVNSGYLHYIEI